MAILRWIADGCPDGVMPDEFHRISAAALRGRGLVSTSGHGSSWRAAVTVAGREYLAKVDGPDPLIARQANVSVTQQLVDDVLAAGGVLRVPQRTWYARGEVDYANRAQIAERLGKVPDGKRLAVVEIDRELEISLVDAPGRTNRRQDVASVAVPQRVGRYHQAARQFRELRDRHEVSASQLPRATRIIHAVALEAERRGWSVEGSGESQNRYGRTGWTGAKDGHLQLAARAHRFWLRLQEEGVHTRGPWEVEVKRYRYSTFYRDRELPSGPYDANATGRLKLELHEAHWWIHRGRQTRFADRQSWKLEERLGHLFSEIEERIVAADRYAEEKRIREQQAAEDAKRQAEEREREWQRLMAQAKERLSEAHRVKHLDQQADAWRQADLVRRYCDAMQARHGQHASTADWIAWARGYADRIDPLGTLPQAPEPPDATLEALQEHLPPGWSARGPEYGQGGHSRW